MIHSWSRNLWLQVAKYYNNLAKELNKKYYSKIDPKMDLAFLSTKDKEWKDYIKEMWFCISYASANRRIILDKVLVSIALTMRQPIKLDPFIDCCHNYAVTTKDWILHRKWSTSAELWELWIIPWSMWTNSYIVEWLGNKASYNSCSHWAGRKMWRKQAVKNLDLNKEQSILSDIWVIHNLKDENNLDEAPSSYKDIDQVMENQKDLVKIVRKLTPLLSIKG
jgi:tRNA-splicing ligase RtcB